MENKKNFTHKLLAKHLIQSEFQDFAIEKKNMEKIDHIKHATNINFA